MVSMRGFSVIELLASLSAAALLLAGLQQILTASAALETETQQQQAAMQEMEFALQRMLNHARNSNFLMLPLVDLHLTSQTEHLRDESVGVAGVTAVLAMTLPASVDRNGDGVADADNDGDGLIDEDTPADMTNDSEPGITGIDDDADQQTDEGLFADSNDDENGFYDDDRRDGVDTDGDASVDEDWGSDANGDNQPGIAGVDDDNDGSIDEGSNNDDDEDGTSDEDWLDPVVYFLSGDQLIERLPVPWDANSDATIDGRDFIERAILDGVTRLRIERVPTYNEAQPLVDITLYHQDIHSVQRELHGRVRVGSAL